MSGREQRILVTRSYAPVPDECANALRLLLEKPVTKIAVESAPGLNGPDVVKESHAHDADENCRGSA